jgi:hypothetical protein
MALALVTVGSPTLAVSPGPTTVPLAASSPGSLQPMVVSTQLWVGENDLLLDLLDADGVRLDDADLSATVALTEPDGVVGDALSLESIQLASRGRTLYRTRVTLPTTGAYAATVTASTGDGQTLVGVTGFDVLPDNGTPALGEAVVPTDTPTLESSGYDLSKITTDPDPLPYLYLDSVRDALRLGRAFVLVIDTVGLGVNNACGSGVGEARTIPAAFPGLWVIHAEPWVNPSGDGVLVNDPAGSPRRIAPWAAAWGVTEPPWLFIVGDDGTLRAKFQGIFGTDELLSALRQVADYLPGAH